jgi:tetratricopeptide (TPR) repeat protein
MSMYRLTFAVLMTTALAGSTLTSAGGAGAGNPSGIAELLDPAAVARHACGPIPKRRTEMFKPGFQLAVAQAATAAQPAADAPPLWDNLGSLSWPVTTKSEAAQRYFDQGLRLAYGFNHAEARRAFRAAQAADPACAMCYWGEAFVLGPNINYPMTPDAVEPAFAAIAKAQALSAGATPKEQALIRALAKRYSPGPGADRKGLDMTYADGMTEVATAFPDDDNVQVLLADALMNLSPWDYWAADATTPKGRTAEIIAALERVLERNQDHPGAIHYYIHAVEASTTPQRAEQHADRLGALIPGVGHVVHMPAHIYYRVGRYKDSLAANVAAVKADEAYFAQVKAEGIYPYGYYPHNVHFVLISAQMGGDGPTAVEAAEKLDRVMSDAIAREVGWVQAIKTAPYFAHAQFTDPDKILALPAPAEEFPFVKASWHYARGVAQAARGDLDGARQEEKALADLAAMSDFAMLNAWGVPAADVIIIAREVILGRIAQAEGQHGDAITAYRKAIEVQDRLPYMEPPYWYYPVRQSLAAAQLAAGQTDDAIQIFRDSLVRTPNNSYALYGLAEALKVKGMQDAAADAEAKFRAAWSGKSTLDLKAL